MENDPPRDAIAPIERPIPIGTAPYGAGFLTIREAQERLGCSRSFLYRAIRSGALPRYRVGYGRGRVVLAEVDVDALAQPRRDRGFTLIELLIVVLIIATLAAIAIPAFGRQQVKAREAAIRSDLVHAGQAVDAYWASAEDPSWDAIRTAGGITTTSATTIALKTAWKRVPGERPVRVSDKRTALGLVTAPVASGAWSQPLGPGEVCVIATNASTRWNYRSGDGARRYDHALYYDSSAGGVRTIAELARVFADGRPVACLGFVRSYVAAGGPY